MAIWAAVGKLGGLAINAGKKLLQSSTKIAQTTAQKGKAATKAATQFAKKNPGKVTAGAAAVAALGLTVSKIKNTSPTTSGGAGTAAASSGLLRYPADLNTESSGYTMFYITARNNRTLLGKTGSMDSGLQSRGLDIVAGRSVNSKKSYAIQHDTMAKISTALPGLKNGATAAGGALAMGAGGAKAAVAGTLAAAMNGAGVAIIASMKGTAETTQLIGSIVLPTPQMAYNYNTTWQEGDGVNNILANAIEASGWAANENISAEDKGFIAGIVKVVTTPFNAAGGAMNAFAGRNQLMGKITGEIPNPLKEQYFSDVGFRTFSFQYTLTPRNINEWNNIQNIITMFKVYALPESSAGSIMWKYPAEFNIIHMFGAKENENLPKHATAILESVSATYGPSGMQVWHNGGIPSVVNLSLTFKEIVIVDANMAAEGF